MAERTKNLGQLLSDSVTLLTENITKFLLVTLIVYLPLIILTVGFKGLMLHPQSFSLGVGFILIMAVIMIVLFVLYPIVIIKMIQSADRGEDLTPMASYREALSIWGPYLIVVLWAIGKVVLWSLLLIIPGILFGILYSFSNMAVLLDGKRGQEALVYSKQIIKPQFWSYVGYSAAVAVIMLILYLAIRFAISAVLGAPTANDTSMRSIIIGTAGNFLTAIVNIYGTIFSYFLYREFKGRTSIV